MEKVSQATPLYPGQIEETDSSLPKASQLPQKFTYSNRLRLAPLPNPSFRAASFSADFQINGGNTGKPVAPLETFPTSPPRLRDDDKAVNSNEMEPKTEDVRTAENPEQLRHIAELKIDNEPPARRGTDEVAPDEEHPDFDNDSSRAVSLQNFSDEQFQNEIMEHFQDFDTDDPPSGYIPAEMLGSLLKNLSDDGVILPVDDDELEMLRSDMDADGNGLIPADEFKDCLVRRRNGEDFSDDELREAFGVFDHHGRGFITAIELRQAMKAIFDIDVPALDARSMVMAASNNGGSKIGLEEFIGIIRWRKNCF